MFNGKSSQRVFGFASALFEAAEREEVRRQRRNSMASHRHWQAQREAELMDPEEFISKGDAWNYRDGDFYLGEHVVSGELIGASTPKNLGTIGGPRTGKDTTTIIQNLLRNPINTLQLDPKAEAADLTAIFRHRVFGHNIAVLDPCGIADVPPEFKIDFNPMLSTSLSDPFFFERLQDIWKGVVFRTGEERDPFWKNAAEDIGQTFSILRYLSSDDIPTLPSVVRDINRPGDPDDPSSELGHLIAEMRGISDPRLKPIIDRGLNHFKTKSADTVRSELNTHLGWILYDYMRASLSRHSTFMGEPFSFKSLRHPNVSIYIVIPRERLSNYRGYLRLMASQAIDAVFEGGDSDLKTWFCLNEAAAVGKLDKVIDNAGVMPSSGAKLHFIWQDIAQARAMMGAHGFNTYYSTCGIFEFLGCSDKDTCEFIASQCGLNPVTQRPMMNWSTVKRHIMPPREGLHIARRKLIYLAHGEHMISIKPKPYFVDFPHINHGGAK